MLVLVLVVEAGTTVDVVLVLVLVVEAGATVDVVLVLVGAAAVNRAGLMRVTGLSITIPVSLNEPPHELPTATR